MIKPMYTIDDGYIELYPFNREFIKNDQNIKSDYKTWFTDQSVTKHNSHGLFPKNSKDFEDYLDMLETTNSNLTLAIIISEKYEPQVWEWDYPYTSKTHIGNVTIQKIDWINRSCEFAVVIGETGYHGKGICTKVAKVIIDHSFNKFGLHRIFSGTSATNIGMQKVFDKLGFTLEGKHRQGMFLNGKFEDVFCYGLLSEEWENKNEINQDLFKEQIVVDGLKVGDCVLAEHEGYKKFGIIQTIIYEMPTPFQYNYKLRIKLKNGNVFEAKPENVKLVDYNEYIKE